jgi:hypothetical protein
MNNDLCGSLLLYNQYLEPILLQQEIDEVFMNYPFPAEIKTVKAQDQFRIVIPDADQA